MPNDIVQSAKIASLRHKGYKQDQAVDTVLGVARKVKKLLTGELGEEEEQKRMKAPEQITGVRG